MVGGKGIFLEGSLGFWCLVEFVRCFLVVSFVSYFVEFYERCNL